MKLPVGIWIALVLGAGIGTCDAYRSRKQFAEMKRLADEAGAQTDRCLAVAARLSAAAKMCGAMPPSWQLIPVDWRE